MKTIVTSIKDARRCIMTRLTLADCRQTARSERTISAVTTSLLNRCCCWWWWWWWRWWWWRDDINCYDILCFASRAASWRYRQLQQQNTTTQL